MINILANDGISQSGKDALDNAGFNISTITVAQEQLANHIQSNDIAVLLVRSATTVRKDLIDRCPNLKIIGRGGVGMDNIDVEYARSKGINVINTPAASSSSVAELVFAHLYGGVRFLHESNRNMPLEGDSNFKKLKKAYAKGVELRGKTLGILGFGRIGRSLASYALGCGMKVIATDLHASNGIVELEINGDIISVDCPLISMEDLLKESDMISLHTPAQADGRAVIGEDQFKLMKQGAFLINAARGGIVDEDALVRALDSGKLSGAALDVFVGEPNPRIDVLSHPAISLTPHTGAATSEAQDRIGLELASQIAEIAST